MSSVVDFTRVAMASRAFSLAAAFGLAVAFHNTTALSAILVVTVIAALAAYLSLAAAIANEWALAAEAAVATLVVVLALPASGLLIPYLVVLTLLAGLSRGLRGAALVGLCQVMGALGLVLTSEGLSGVFRQAELLAPWSLTIAGAGVLGAWIRSTGRPLGGSSLDQTYDSARRLLGQLRQLARRLPSGLDPASTAAQMLSLIEDRTTYCRTAVLVRTEGGVFAPLAFSGPGSRECLDPTDRLVSECWKRASIQTSFVNTEDAGAEPAFALPLRLGSEVLGVIYGRGTVLERDEFEGLQPSLDELSLRLATALAFDELRTLVTTDERQRLAREIHDGVAQEVASLGYVLDNLAAVSNDADVSEGLQQLRGELGRVVTELRLSIFDLRSDVGDGPGLGAALSEYVRMVGARSSIRVHLTLDESPTRLSPGVETEFFRIAQEAITNARKHSGAANLWVDCWVRSPSARIQVRDDGRGLGVGRADSYGLRIMRERADRIEATVRIDRASTNRDHPGTCVTIAIGSEEPPMLERVGVGAA